MSSEAEEIPDEPLEPDVRQLLGARELRVELGRAVGAVGDHGGVPHRAGDVGRRVGR